MLRVTEHLQSPYDVLVHWTYIGRLPHSSSPVSFCVADAEIVIYTINSVRVLFQIKLILPPIYIQQYCQCPCRCLLLGR